jgi:hypothetical protein
MMWDAVAKIWLGACQGELCPIERYGHVNGTSAATWWARVDARHDVVYAP